MPEKEIKHKDAFDEMIEMINQHQFDIETIDSKDPATRGELYDKLRKVLENNFPEIIDAIKFSGRGELDDLEEKLKKNPDSLKYRVLRIIRSMPEAKPIAGVGFPSSSSIRLSYRPPPPKALWAASSGGWISKTVLV